MRTVASIEGPDGAPVVILANPIGTTRAIWDAQARVLREDFRLLRFELRGHGAPGAQSDAPPGPYSIADLGTDVLGLMREHGVATAAYCGISIGGMMGLWLAANAADPVLCSIGELTRRATLIAMPEPEGQLRFDIRLQGDRETVFFDV